MSHWWNSTQNEACLEQIQRLREDRRNDRTKANWTKKEQWTHSKRAGETAVSAEQIRTSKETRERYTRCSKGKPDTPEEKTRKIPPNPYRTKESIRVRVHLNVHEDHEKEEKNVHGTEETIQWRAPTLGTQRPEGIRRDTPQDTSPQVVWHSAG